MKKIKYDKLSYEAVNALMCYNVIYTRIEKAKNIDIVFNHLVINRADLGLCRFLGKTHPYSHVYFNQWYTAHYIPAFYHITPHTIIEDQHFYNPTELRYAVLLSIRMRIQLLNTYIEHLNYVGSFTDFVDESGYIILPDVQRETIRKHAQSKGVWKAPNED